MTVYKIYDSRRWPTEDEEDFQNLYKCITEMDSSPLMKFV